jgi:hypothetical protein
MPAERGRDASADSIDASGADGPALRDAAAAARRAADDEERAAATRARLQGQPLDTLEPDEAIAPHLGAEERVHAVRERAILRAPGGDTALGYGGTLYLTSRRLVHLGQVVVGVQLTDIVETSLAGERLLLSLRDSEGVSLDVDRPRELRAEIAAATRTVRR